VKTLTLTLRGLAAGAIVVDLLASFASCGTSTSSQSLDGGSGDAARSSTADGGDGGAEGAPGHDGSPSDASVGPGAAAYCNAGNGLAERCEPQVVACLEAYYDAGLDAAITKNLEACTAEWPTFYSDAFLEVLATCYVEPLPCCTLMSACPDATAAFTADAEACAARALEKVTPDPADEKVKTDFCKVCPDTASKAPVCKGFFSFAAADAAPPDSGLSEFPEIGFGSFLLAFPDAVVDLIDENCTGSALSAFDAGSGVTDCYLRFDTCAVAVDRAYNAAHEPKEPDASVPAACRGEAGMPGAPGGSSP
jgi:hypothetical protein